MTTQLEQAARLALEALLYAYNEDEAHPETLKSITALRAALEQPASGIKQVIELYDSPEQPAQQEPIVRWICKGCGHEYMEAPSSCDCMESREYERIEYYTRPQQPAQDEPVAWQWLDTGNFRKNLPSTAERSAWRPLYTRPQAREPEKQEPVAVPTTSYEHRKFVLVGREWYERFAAFHDDCQIGAVLTREEQTVRQQGYENGWNDAQRYLREVQATRPQAREWQGLTMEDKKRVLDNDFGGSRADCMDAAEKILREKNQ